MTERSKGLPGSRSHRNGHGQRMRPAEMDVRRAMRACSLKTFQSPVRGEESNLSRGKPNATLNVFACGLMLRAHAAV